MPIEPNLLKQIITDQKEDPVLPIDYIPRTQEGKLNQFAKTKEIVVLTGIRRCGKSVLLQRLRQNAVESDYYFNFEDERLANFTAMDFQVLQTTFIEMFGMQKTFYFDEIQNIPHWEMFVRRLYNSGNKIFITGSNANLFSEELGTRLTGRYLPIQIYPLSFQELIHHQLPTLVNKSVFSTTDVGKIKNAYQQYHSYGGIPEFLQNRKIEYLHTLYESILYRDIMARYKITHDINIKKLIFFLASNCSKEISFNSLRKLLEIGSVTTISNYCGYLENSYLCFFVSRYSDSARSQLQSPKKIYFIDHVIARTLGFRFSEDIGRILENIVFIELKRRNVEIYYYQKQKECDFIIRQGATTLAAIQVCQHLEDPAIKQREFAGLFEALTYFSLQEGYILTENTESTEQYTHEGVKYTIHILPIWKWLLSSLHQL